MHRSKMPDAAVMNTLNSPRHGRERVRKLRTIVSVGSRFRS